MNGPVYSTQWSNGNDANFTGNNQTITVNAPVSPRWMTASGSNIVLSGSSAISMSGGFNITVASGKTMTISAPLIGSTGQLLADGAGTLTLSGTNTHAAGTTISTGTLVLNSPAALGTGTLSFGSGGTLDTTAGPLTLTTNNPQTWSNGFIFKGSSSLDLGTGAVTLSAGTRAIAIHGSTLTVGGVIAGAGNIQVEGSGTGTLQLNGENTYTGNTTVIPGAILAVGSNTAIGTGTLALNGGTLRGSGGARALTNAFTISSSGATLDGSSDLTLGGTGTITATTSSLTLNNTGNTTITGDVILNSGSGTKTLTVKGSGNATFSGVLKVTSGVGALTKSETGTVTLSGANTYVGNTTVSGGNLWVTGSLATGNVIVSGGRLGGTGTIGGNTTVSSGSIAPGTTGAGLLSFSRNLTVSTNGSIALELAGTTRGSGHDAINVTSALTAGGTLNVTLSGDFTPAAGDSFDLFDAGSVSGTFAAVNLPTLPSTLTWNQSALYTTGVIVVEGAADPAPLLVSVVRQSPTTTNTTATSVTWRFTFNETVTGVAAADFAAAGTPTGTLSVTPVSGSVYDVTLASITGEGAITIGFASGFSISDTGGTALTNTAPITTLENEFLRTNPLVAPTIAVHPATKTAPGLQPTTLTVSANGTAPFTYQWFKDDQEIPGQIFATLQLPQVLFADAGVYKVTVTNSVSSVTSNPATLTVAPYVLNSSPDRSVGLGGKQKFFVTAEGSGTLTYQWRKSGEAIGGATNSTYEIAAVALTDAANYDVVVGHNSSATTTTSPAAVLSVLPNPIASFATTSIDGAAGITGYFSIDGSLPKKVVVAAYGPALTSVSSAIADPQIVIENATGTTAAANDNWSMISDDTFAATYARLGLPALTAGSKDAVVYTTLSPGSYRVRVTGVSGATGNVRLAIADADINPPSRISYVAVRGPVSPSAPLTGGFTIVNSADKKMLVRAIGPTLGSAGLADPALTIYDTNGTSVVGGNDNWGGGATLTDAFAQAGAFALAADSKDAALVGATRIGTGTYTAQVTSASGSGDVLWEAYDLNGTTAATSAPIIIVAPVNQSAASGNVSFSVVASGGGTLTYKWKKGTTVIDTATTATLTLNNITSADAADYTVEVSNTAGTATATASLHVIPSISTVTGPTAATYKAGATLGFTVAYSGNVTVTGTPRLAFTLGTSPVYATYTSAGSTATSLVFNYTVAAGDNDADGIACATTLDLNGGSLKDSANNDAGLTFTAPTLTGVLVDTTAPTVASIAYHTPASGTTTATSVTWRVTFSETVAGVAAADFTTSGTPTGTLSVSPASGTTYDVTLGSISGFGTVTLGFASGFSISDTAGNTLTSATSTGTNDHTFTVQNPVIAPTIATPPASKTVAGLGSTTFTVVANGTEPFAYQWYHDNSPLDGQTGATLSLPFVLLKDAGAYKVKVSNSAGDATSDAATLTVGPYVLNSSPDRSVGLGGKQKFFVTAEGSGTLTYQWRKAGEPIGGATNATYEIAAVALTQAGSYDVVVGHNASGTTATSPAAILTALPNPIVSVVTAAIAGVDGVTGYFTVEGTQPKKLIIAAYGPALASSGAISDPQLVLENASGVAVASNDNWGTIEDGTFAATYARLGLTPLTAASTDAVLYRTVDAGSYRVRITGVGGATGNVRLAIGDADLNPASRVAYVALRATVSPSAPLTGGFTIVNSADKKVLFRAVGPTLGASGVVDPILTLYDSDGTTVAAGNDNWGGGSTLTDAFTQAGAFALGTDSKDAALLGAMRIGTGSYTAQVTTASGSGEVLWEAYDLNGTTPSTSAPIIVATPVNQSVTGGNVSFHVLAAGGGPLTYKWKKGSTVIDGATTSTLTLNNVAAGDAADYTIEVSNTAGTATATASLHYVPSISGVTPPTAGSYKAGATLGFTVAFSGNVVVTGTPRIALTVGSSSVYANYTATGSTATSLKFNYTVAAGDTDTDGIAATGGIDLNGGSIKDSANNNVGLTFTAPTLTAVLVDTTAPTAALASTLTGLSNAATIPLTITFSENVTDFTVTDLTVVGATPGNFAGSGKTYTTDLTPTGDGTITVDLAANKAEDAAGNGNTAATQFSIVSDRTAPNAPTIVSITEDTGGSSTDLVTADATLKFTGTAEANSSVALTWAGGSGVIGTTTTDGAGAWTVDATSTTLPAGTLTFTAKATDAAGNTSAASASFGVTVDLTAPTVTLATTATSPTRTNPIPVAITFSEAVSGFTVEDLAVSGGTAASFSGSGASYTVSITPTADGTITVNLAAAKAQDIAGNDNTAATTLSLTYDGTAPNAPVVASISTDTGASANDGITSDTTLVLTGTAEANASIEVFRGTTSLGSVSAGSGGAWTFDATATALPDASYAFTAKAKDAAGNVSSASSPFAVTIDTAAPAAPVILAISDDTGPSSTDKVTSDTTLMLSGTAEAGSVVTLTRVGSGTLGTATAGTDGAWSYDYTATALGAGEHSFTATTKDVAGNVSDASAALIATIDTATATPAIASISTDSGKSTTDGITNDTTLTLTGTAEANSKVALTRSGVTDPLGTVTADGAGAWTFDYTATSLVDGSYLFNAKATDTAGNVSAISADFPVVIDTAAPAAPVIVALATDSGSSASDLVTTDRTLVLNGTAEAGSKVELFLGTTSLGSFEADATTGAWSFDYTATTLDEGAYTFTAKATDAAGNTSVASTEFVVTVDFTAPVITSATTAAGTYKSAFAFTVTASGAATSFAATGLPAGLALDATTGVISGAPTDSGTFTVALTATDAAGNSSTGTLTLTIAKVNLTVAGITAGDRIYDATAAVTLNLANAALVGVVGSDTVQLDATAAIGVFADKLIGASKPVAISGLQITGTHASHYSLTQPATTATIGAKTLTVSGITANSRAYNGALAATLNLGGAALVGVVPGDTVSLVTTAAAGTFGDANVGIEKPVAISGLVLAGADAANYALTAPVASAHITPASVTIVFSNLNHVYDGTVKQATISASPNVPLNVLYSPASPTNAGSYSVGATVTDSNYAGFVNATLTIAKAPQTIALNVAGSATLGTPLPITASASSGRPVTLSIVSGNGTLSGTMLTLNTPGSVTIRATEAGDQNLAEASAEATVTVAGKLAQTIAFGAPTDRLSNSGSFTLNATATSGLPVSFAIIGGPAMLSGNTLTLTGAAGRVIVRASQPGNAIYDAAPDVNVGFTVTAATLNVFFGTVSPAGNNTPAGNVAATLPPNSNQGNLLVVAPNLGLNTVLDFTLNADGTFTQTAIIDVANSGGSSGAPGRAAAPMTVTIRGTLVNGQISGTVEPLGIAFSANVLPVTGPSANAAGFYRSSTLANTSGATYSVVGTNNQVLVLAQTPAVTTGGMTTLNSDGTFGLQTQTAAGIATIRGTVDEPTTTVAGTISLPGAPDTSFAGLVVTTTRTDRLINLSSRVRIGAGDRVLITGFVIGGSEPKQVLIRGVGPALTAFGVQGALANPRIQIFRGGEVVAENDNWSAAGNGAALTEAFARVGAFGLAANSADAALLTTLPPGAYTAQVLDGGGSGVALAEIYDASVNPNSEYQRMVNISTRGEAGAGENVLIGGFVVTGNAPKKLLVRGIGPGLAAFGVAGTLADPRLQVFRDAEILAENDNWSAGAAADPAALTAAAQATGAFALAANSRDAALILTLAPGTYTAQVGAANGTATGVALVEIYEIPE